MSGLRPYLVAAGNISADQEQAIASEVNASRSSQPEPPIDRSVIDTDRDQLGPRLDSTVESGDSEPESLLTQPQEEDSSEESLVWNRNWADRKANGSDRFKILKPHAEGGFGIVNEAIDLMLQRKVALKHLQPKYVNNNTVRRKLLFEAEVTGQLDHPAIVPVYASGLDRSGNPYYVMRFIQGATLQAKVREFNAERLAGKVGFDSPSFRQLLQRFVSACQAVEYAHSKGVLHRDLKSINIMLGDFGETLVVDWGIAKKLSKVSGNALAESVAGKDPEFDFVREMEVGSGTRFGDFLGTGPYAPLEQLSGQLDQLGPHTDVYALGAVLFEIVTGKRYIPEDVRDRGTIVRLIQSGELRSPIQIVTDCPKSLDAICKKALAPNNEDRYANVAPFRQDIESFLNDLPVSVRPESIAIKAGRFARRNATLVATAGTILLCSVLGLGAFGLLLISQNQAIEEQRLLAVRAKEDSDSLAKLWTKVITRSLPSEENKGMTVLESLKLAEEEFAKDQGVTPSRKMHFLSMMMDTYVTVADGPSAMKCAKQMQQLVQEGVGLTAAEKSVGLSHVASGLWTAGEGEEAIKVLVQAVAEMAKSHQESDPDFISSTQNLAMMYDATSQFGKAKPLFEKVIALQGRFLDPHGEDALMTQRNVAMNLIASGQTEEGMNRLRDTVKNAKEHLGPLNMAGLQIVQTLGSVSSVGEEVVSNLEFALEGYKKQLPENSPLVMMTRAELFSAYLTSGKFTDASKLMKEALQQFDQLENPPKQELSDGQKDVRRKTRGLLVVALLEIGEYSQVESMLRNAEADKDDLYQYLPPPRRSTFLAKSLLRQGKLAEAEAAIHTTEAMSDLREIDQMLLECLRAELVLAQGDLAKAEPLLISALEKSRATKDDLYTRIGQRDMLNALVRLNQSRSDQAQVEKWQKELQALGR